MSRRVRHLLCIALVGLVYDLQLLYEPPNPIDEGWPLYAAQRLHDGALVVDLHADSLLWGRDLLKPSTQGQVDLPRLRRPGEEADAA